MTASRGAEPTGPIGVIGVGSLAESIVRGLTVDGPATPEIVLSPRGRERGRALTADLRGVTVAGDNQAVLDRARTVLVCVRPQDAAAVLAPLTFRPEHRVVSVMAGVRLEHLMDLVAPASRVWRSVPNPGVQHRHGVTPLYPGGGVAEDIFQSLGGAMVVAREELLHAAGTASATVATVLRVVDTAAAWLTRQGVDHAEATTYLSSLFAGVGEGLRDVDDLSAEAAAHATPGGVNERLARMLQDQGFFRQLDDALASLDVATRALD